MEEEGKQETIDVVRQYVEDVAVGRRKMVVISVVDDEISVSLMGASFDDALKMLKGSYELAVRKISEALDDESEEKLH